MEFLCQHVFDYSAAKTLLILVLLFEGKCLINAQDAMQQTSGSPIKVRQFHVSSKLYSRFAKVTIDSEVLNVDKNSKEVSFQVQVPEAAFMSNFTMVVGGVVHSAEVLEKREAQVRYYKAREKDQIAGKVKQETLQSESGMDRFTISVNLAPQSSAHFTLEYNELLERRKGIYKQTLVVQPGAIVEDMSVSASFAEHQGFKSFAYTLPGSDQRLTGSSSETTMTAKPDARELVFRPTVEMQRAFNPQKGIHGEFTIYYSISDEVDGGNIIVQNDYFAHFFAPPGLETLPKNILFVIDISGSMDGQKIAQVRVAMEKILNDLRDHASDMFSILLFNDKCEIWRDQPTSTLGTEIDAAQTFADKKLVSNGGTDIHMALMEGLDILLGENEEKSCDVANIIVFLTDGSPTSGVTDEDQIASDVAAKNRDRASIYSLGFGFNLNYGLLSKISGWNRGFARRIYVESDASIQLQDFYEEISSPLLCDVVAHYNTDVVVSEFLTQTVFPLFHSGTEIVVAGKTRMAGNDLASLDAELKGIGRSGTMTFAVPGGNVRLITETTVADDLTQKLWAYMKIKSLLKKMDTVDSEAEKNKLQAQALNMSLTYSFVTPLTSFSIVVEDRGARQNERRDSGIDGKRPFKNFERQDSYHDTASSLGWSVGVVLLLVIRLLVFT